MALRPIADGVWQLTGHPPHALNCYLLGDVLVDTATRWARARVLRDLRSRRLSMVALTHCHPDHQGLAKVLCEQRRIPLACHEADVPAMEGTMPMQPNTWLLRLGVRLWSGPARPVDRVLRDGDELAGFRVIHAPGHTPGHFMLFRDSDRLAIAGDLLANVHFVKMKAELTLPPPWFSCDPKENRRSIKMLASLEPRTVCFGHGPPLYEGWRIREFVERWKR